jgi:hypothetical protein
MISLNETIMVSAKSFIIQIRRRSAGKFTQKRTKHVVSGRRREVAVAVEFSEKIACLVVKESYQPDPAVHGTRLALKKLLRLPPKRQG